MEWTRIWSKDSIEIWKTPTMYCVGYHYRCYWKFTETLQEARELASEMLIEF